MIACLSVAAYTNTKNTVDAGSLQKPGTLYELIKSQNMDYLLENRRYDGVQ